MNNNKYIKTDWALQDTYQASDLSNVVTAAPFDFVVSDMTDQTASNDLYELLGSPSVVGLSSVSVLLKVPLTVESLNLSSLPSSVSWHIYSDYPYAIRGTVAGSVYCHSQGVLQEVTLLSLVIAGALYVGCMYAGQGSDVQLVGTGVLYYEYADYYEVGQRKAWLTATPYAAGTGIQIDSNQTISDVVPDFVAGTGVAISGRTISATALPVVLRTSGTGMATFGGQQYEADLQEGLNRLHSNNPSLTLDQLLGSVTFVVTAIGSCASLYTGTFVSAASPTSGYIRAISYIDANSSGSTWVSQNVLSAAELVRVGSSSNTVMGQLILNFMLPHVVAMTSFGLIVGRGAALGSTKLTWTGTANISVVLEPTTIINPIDSTSIAVTILTVKGDPYFGAVEGNSYIASIPFVGNLDANDKALI